MLWLWNWSSFFTIFGTVMSHFPAQLITLVSVLTASSCWRSRTNSANWLTIPFFLKLTKLISSLVFSMLDYCSALLSGSSQAFLNKIQTVINCSAHLICKSPKSAYITPLLFDLHWPIITNQQPESIQNSSHCFHIVWYSSSIPLWVCFIYTFLSLLSLKTSIFWEWDQDPRREVISIHQICYMELFLSVSGIPLQSLQQKLKTHLFSSAYYYVILVAHICCTMWGTECNSLGLLLSLGQGHSVLWRCGWLERGGRAGTAVSRVCINR